MRTNILKIIFSFTLCLPVYAVDDHSADHSAHQTPAKGSNQNRHGTGEVHQGTSGRKWMSDSALRSGMNEIQLIVDSYTKKILETNGSVTNDLQASTGIQTQVNLIFKNCKLEPDADAALHTILTQVLSGNAALKKARSLKDRRAGAQTITQAIQNYRATFTE